MKLALDAMGGDFAPQATVAGAVLAARELGLEIVLVGDRSTIAKELAEHDASLLPITIEHAPEVVTMDDSPVESILAKPHSSLHVGYDLLKRGAVSGFVSAGNSGAILTTGIVILGNLPGVDRPAIAASVPSAQGLTLLIDGGANTEVKSFNLVQFAIMGSVYWRHMHETARPRVGVLANGEEESKGTDLTRAAAATLREMAPDLNFIGYVEGRDINLGKVDVVVTDGFTGNVSIKTMEGFAKFLLGSLREVFASGIRGRLAYMLVRKQLAAMRDKIDPAEYGGAPLLGINGVAIIAHGSSDPRAIRSALRAAGKEAASRNLRSEIVDLLGKIPTTTPAKAGGKGIRGLFSKMRERLARHPREGEAERRSEVGPPVPPATHDPDNDKGPGSLHAEQIRAEQALNGAAPDALPGVVPNRAEPPEHRSGSLEPEAAPSPPHPSKGQPS